jgi:hypothetical protein
MRSTGATMTTCLNSVSTLLGKPQDINEIKRLYSVQWTLQNGQAIALEGYRPFKPNALCLAAIWLQVRGRKHPTLSLSF